VDAQFRTTVPHIFAVGDVIGFPSLASTSMEQGRQAACYALEVPVATFSGILPYGIYTIPEMSMVGKTEQTLTEERVPYETGVARYAELAKAQMLGDDKGMLKLLFHRDTRALLGVHIIGARATELIHVGQAVLAFEGTIDYFIETVFNYPTLAEAYKVAAYDGINKL
jgi:NAD(P) transhydrogenase